VDVDGDGRIDVITGPSAAQIGEYGGGAVVVR
jgi:hypothetical protein